MVWFGKMNEGGEIRGQKEHEENQEEEEEEEPIQREDVSLVSRFHFAAFFNDRQTFVSSNSREALEQDQKKHSGPLVKV